MRAQRQMQVECRIEYAHDGDQHAYAADEHANAAEYADFPLFCCRHVNLLAGLADEYIAPFGATLHDAATDSSPMQRRTTASKIS